MDITQTFYDNMASQYDKLFLDWNATTQEQAVILNKIFNNNGFSISGNCFGYQRWRISRSQSTGRESRSFNPFRTCRFLCLD